MLNRRAFQATALLLAATGVWPLAQLAFGQEPAPEKVSTYAPAKELIAQLNLCMEEISESLADAETFEEKSKTFNMNAATVVVIAQHLALHDEANELKKSAPAIFHAGSKLSEVEDFEAAQKAFAILQASINDESSEAEMPTWDPVVEMEPLMEEVGFLNSKLRRSVRRLKRNQDEIAQFSATLAALAQAVSPDLSFTGDEEDAKQWMAMCGDMREACRALSAAAMADDEDAANSAIEALDQSCKDCHEMFR